MPRLVTRLDAREISLVGKPANRRTFAIVKADDTTPEEGKQMDEQTQEQMGALEEVIGRFETYALDNSDVEEMVADLREKFDALHEGLAEEKAARRKPEEYGYGYPEPKKRPKTKTEALIEKLAGQLVEKAAFSDRPLTKAQAWEKVIKANPDLYTDYTREREALAHH